MNETTSFLLPLIPLIPLMAALFVALAESDEAGRRVAFLCGTIPALGLAGVVMGQLIRTPGLLVVTAWRGFLYADLLSCLFIVCAFALVTAVGVYSFAYMRVDYEKGIVTEEGLRHYYSLLLVFCAFLTWTVTISHLFFVFLVVEIATIAISFLVATEKTKFALIASFKYNLLVVVAMLFAVMGSIAIFARMSSDYPSLTRINLLEMGKLAALVPAPVALIVVACFTCGFGTKGGMMPFHSWLPDAHSEAPAPISALLSGLVIAIGPFLFARTVTFFSPRYSAVSLFIAGVACVSIVIGILLAIAQDDLKRLLAYSSISQIGYIFAGISLGTYLGLYGGFFHIVTHLLAKSLLFLCAGAVIYRVGIRKISDLGGLARKMPVTAFCFFVGALSMGGMPFLAGFMSKYTIILALAQVRMWWAMSIAILAGVLTLAGLVWAANRVFWSEESPKVAALEARSLEAPLPMLMPMLLIAGLTVFFGILPQTLYPALDGAVKSVLAMFSS
jgi:formate hydrogenlyase subunit 3/multisubunit Na+/H+ antiporter MnhD subunit